MQIIVIGSGGDYRDGGNAASIHTRELVNNLSKDCSVISFFVSSQRIADNIEASKIITIPFFSNALIRTFFYYLILPIYFTLYFCINRSKVIYARFGALSFAATIASKVAGKKLFTEVNGLKVDEMMMNKKGKKNVFKTYFVQVLEKFVFRFSDGLITVTEGIKRNIKESYNIDDRKITVIPNGVNEEVYKPQINSKKALGLKNELRYICFVGYLAKWQGVSNILRAAVLVIKKHSNARFLIIGDGPEKSYLEQAVKEMNLQTDILFTGHVPYTEIPKYISSSEFCLAPWTTDRNSKIGLSPLKLYAYFAVAKPVITSEIKGVHEDISRYNLGIIIDPSNPEKFENAITYYLDNPNEAQAAGERARDYVLQGYTWRKSAEKLLSFIDRLSPKTD